MDLYGEKGTFSEGDDGAEGGKKNLSMQKYHIPKHQTKIIRSVFHGDIKQSVDCCPMGNPLTLEKGR